MKFLAIERPVDGASPETTRSLLVAEAQRVWELYLAGILREISFTDKHDAVLMLECGSEREAQKAIDTLPLVRERQVRFDLTALKPYTGIARLFRAGIVAKSPERQDNLPK